LYRQGEGLDQACAQIDHLPAETLTTAIAAAIAVVDLPADWRWPHRLAAAARGPVGHQGLGR